MPEIRVFDNEYKARLNTTGDIFSPGNEFGIGIFSEIDFSNVESIQTGLISSVTKTQGGHSYSIKAKESTYYGILITMTYEYDNQTIAIIQERYGSASIDIDDVLLYSGRALMARVFSGSDLIQGGPADDVIWGWTGDDSLYGGSGSDVLYGGPGLDLLDGGHGSDKVIFDFDFKDYSISRTSDNQIVVTSKAGEVDWIRNIEQLAFRDETKTSDAFDLYWGQFNTVRDKSNTPVYRFFNTRDSAFFYTANLEEKNLVIDKSNPNRNNINEWPYVYQGANFEAAHTYPGQAVSLHRFYNYSTGHHFFTANSAERDYLNDKINQQGWTFRYEGAAFSVYQFDPTPSAVGQEAPVFRFYSPTLDRHFFTASQEEFNNIVATGVWNYEGIGFFGELPGP